MAKAKLYEFKAPSELLPFHIIVKMPPTEHLAGRLTHLFVFAEDQGSAVNAAVVLLDNPEGHDIADLQFTAKASTHLGGGVYQM